MARAMARAGAEEIELPSKQLLAGQGQCPGGDEGRFPPAGCFRAGPRYFYLRAVGLLGRLCGCRCRAPREWEDPRARRRGQVRPHTPLNASQAAGGGACGAAGRLCLSGRGSWRFRLFADPAQAERSGAAAAGFSDGDWDQIDVPSHWQLLGYEPPVYTNLVYPFSACPIRRPSLQAANPTGVYRRKFSLPAGMDVRAASARLLLNGVSAAARVWLDGEELGFTHDSGTPAEFDVTRVLRRSGPEHELVVFVMKFCVGSLLEDQDTWWLSGIFRDVVVYLLPEVNAIEDYNVTAVVQAPYDEAADAEVQVDVALRQAAGEVSVQLLDGERVLAEGRCSSPVPARDLRSEPRQAAGDVVKIFGDPGVQIARARLGLKAPAKWSPERPKLYTLRVSLRHADELLQEERTSFGVRDVRISAGVLRLNGRPLLVNGVNRVEFHSDYGKALPEDVIREDLLLLKRQNFNAVRNAHCPNAPVFYRICDELGLAVVDEANMENHGFAMLGAFSFPQCDPAFQDIIVDRARAMFGRAKCHACVVGWSLGNESGVGPNTQAAADFLRACDPTRFLQYESGEEHGDACLMMGNGRHPISDIVCPMYADPERCLALAREEQRPVIMCEYSHAMGNSNGGLCNFYRLFRDEAYPSVQGGFVWDFADQGLKAPRKPKPAADEDWYLERNWGYGGDFGPKSGETDCWFCCNGLVLPDRTLKPAMTECKYLMQPLAISIAWEAPAATVACSLRGPGGPRSDFGPGLRGLTLRWVVQDSRAEPVAQGEHACGDGARSEFTVSVPSVPEGGGLWMRVAAEISEDAPYARRGHVVAQEGAALFPLPARSPLPERVFPAAQAPGGRGAAVVCPLAESPVTAGETGRRPSNHVPVREVAKGEFEVSAETYTARVREGEIVSLASADGAELLSGEHGSPVGHAFWRAATDNDRSAGDLFAPKPALPLLRAAQAHVPPALLPGFAETSTARRWLMAGLEGARMHTVGVSWSESQVLVEGECRPADGQVALFEVCTAITFCATTIRLSVRVRAGAAAKARLSRLPTLPRVGMRLVLAPSLSRCSWLGRGPHECYPDRKASAFEGIHTREVEEMHVPYAVPGEDGGVADVRWAALQDGAGRGLLVQYSCADAAPAAEVVETGVSGARPAGMCGAQVSAARWTPEQAHGARHDFELPRGKDKPVVLHVDTAHAGVGGTGGATDAVWRSQRQYLVDPCTPEWTYELELTPLAPGQLDVRRSS